MKCRSRPWLAAGERRRLHLGKCGMDSTDYPVQSSLPVLAGREPPNGKGSTGRVLSEVHVDGSGVHDRLPGLQIGPG